ncbi:TetR family transcriptional regulator [Betaproteobacteria bacterium]|nr:TetR family transcriptional regulator [Betaproteobacteria bacterium]
MARKNKEEALATRSAILDAAEIVFQERGVSKASLAEIAAAAGVTRGAIYWHFANKVEVFDAMVQRVIGLMEAKLEELQKERHDDDPVELMRELSLYFLDRLANDPHYFRIINISWHKCEYVGEMAEICDKHLEHGKRFLDISMGAFQTSRERGHLSLRVDPRTAAIGLMAVVDGLITNWMLYRPVFSLVDTGAEIIDNYLLGLRS